MSAMTSGAGDTQSAGPGNPGPAGASGVDPVAPANASRAPAAPAGIDVWERWLPFWNVYVVLVLVASTALAFAGGSFGTRPPEGAGSTVAVALVVLQAAGFWFVWIRRSVWDQPFRLRAAYVVFLLVSFVILIRLAGGFQLLQFSLYPQVFFAIPGPWAVAAALTLVPILAGDALISAGGDVATAAPTILTRSASVVVFTFVSAWISAIIRQSDERRRLIRELREARVELATAERQAGVLEERARLARDIHDTLAQGFASVVTQLEAAGAVLAEDPARARRHIDDAETVARASLSEARALVWALRPDAIATAGLAGAIRRLATAPGSTGVPSVEVEISGPARPLHPDVEVTLLRAAQESLANARRHAAASHVTVTLTYFDDEVNLDVVDDGGGFDPAAPRSAGPAGGFGLRGMQERTERLGGRFTLESAPGEGTAVTVQLPAIAPAGSPDTSAGAGELPPAPAGRWSAERSMAAVGVDGEGMEDRQ